MLKRGLPGIGAGEAPGAPRSWPLQHSSSVLLASAHCQRRSRRRPSARLVQSRLSTAPRRPACARCLGPVTHLPRPSNCLLGTLAWRVPQLASSAGSSHSCPFSLRTHWRGQVLGVHPESGVRCYSRAEPCPPSPDRHRCLISICRPSRINGLDAPADPPGPTFLVPFWVGTRVAGHPLLCVLNSRLVFAPRGPHSCTGRGLGNSSSSPTDQRVQFFHAASSLLVFGSNWKCLALHLDSVSTPSSPIGGVTLQRARSLGGASTLLGTSSIRPPPSPTSGGPSFQGGHEHVASLLGFPSPRQCCK